MMIRIYIQRYFFFSCRADPHISEPPDYLKAFLRFNYIHKSFPLKIRDIFSEHHLVLRVRISEVRVYCVIIS